MVQDVGDGHVGIVELLQEKCGRWKLEFCAAGNSTSLCVSGHCTIRATCITKYAIFGQTLRCTNSCTNGTISYRCHKLQMSWWHWWQCHKIRHTTLRFISTDKFCRLKCWQQFPKGFQVSSCYLLSCTWLGRVMSHVSLLRPVFANKLRQCKWFLKRRENKK